jgi:hypothetical protein
MANPCPEDTAFDLGFLVGAGEGNRTLMTSLEGWGSAIELRPRVRHGIDPAPMRTDSVPAPPRAAGATVWVRAAARRLGQPGNRKVSYGSVSRDVAQLG